jgi:hypothetical protein
MSYPKSLDEFPAYQLEAELSRRKQLQEQGKCDYCGRSVETLSCKFPERHRRPQRAPKVVKTYR